MKKSTKILLGIAGGIALLGTLLVLLAVIMGASWDDVQIGVTYVIKPAIY